MSLKLVLVPPKEKIGEDEAKQFWVKYLLCLLDIRNNIKKC